MTKMTFDDVRKNFKGPVFGIAYATDEKITGKQDMKKMKNGQKMILYSNTDMFSGIGFLDMVKNRSQARTIEVTSEMGGKMSDGYYNTLYFSVKGTFAGIPGAEYLTFVTGQRIKSKKSGDVISDYTYPNKRTMGL